MCDMDPDELRDNKNLIRSWLRETLMPLSENVADRTESDGGAQAHMPALMKDLRWAATDEIVNDDVLKEFEEDIQFDFKDRDVALRMFVSAVKDLALMSHVVRTIDAITDGDPFYERAANACGLDDFGESKHKALLKWTEGFLLKFCVNNLQIESSDDEEELGNEDSDDSSVEEEDDEDAAGIEKDSDDSEEEEGGEGEEVDDNESVDSETERQLMATVEPESDDDKGVAEEPVAKRARAE